MLGQSVMRQKRSHVPFGRRRIWRVDGSISRFGIFRGPDCRAVLIRARAADTVAAMSKLKHRKLRKEIIATCREMNALGINQGSSGNISARIDGGFLITPSGIPYDLMQPEQIVEMDLAGGYFGDFLPSSEWRMHYDIYRARPEASAVVHNHSTFCAALSCRHVTIPAFHYMIGVGGGTTIRCAKYATFGTQELSDHMLTALQDRKACLLANHGMICFGPNLRKALWLAVEVETLAKQYWYAKRDGKPFVLGDDEMQGVLARFQSYGQAARRSEAWRGAGGRAAAAPRPAGRRQDQEGGESQASQTGCEGQASQAGGEGQARRAESGGGIAASIGEGGGQ